MVNRTLKRYGLVYNGLEILLCPFRHKALFEPLRFMRNDVRFTQGGARGDRYGAHNRSGMSHGAPSGR